MNGSQKNSDDKSAQPGAMRKIYTLPPLVIPPTPQPQKTGTSTPKTPSADEQEPVEVVYEQGASIGDEVMEQAENQDGHEEQDPLAVEAVSDTGETVVGDPAADADLNQTQNENSAEKGKPRRSGQVLKESKKKSSGNAITHGITSMRLLHDESRADFEEIYKDLSAKYPPQGPLEKLCLERILMYHYRLRRLWRIETEMMQHLMEQEQEQRTAKDVSLGASIQKELNQAVSFESLQRYEAAIERQLRRAIGELLVLQKIIPCIEDDPAHVAAFLRQLG